MPRSCGVTLHLRHNYGLQQSVQEIMASGKGPPYKATLLVLIVMLFRDMCSCAFIGLAYQGKDMVFRFIIDYSCLMDFGP